MNLTPADADNQYFIPTFGNVGADTEIKFSQLKPADFENLWIDGNDWLGTIQLGGEEEAMLGFDGENWYVSSVTDPSCEWQEGDILNDVAVPLKRGMIVYTLQGCPIQVAGEVVRGDSELYAAEGENSYTGNFTPVAFTLGDLVVDKDFWIDGNDWLGTIQLGGEEDYVFGYNPEEDFWYFQYSTSGAICYDKDGNEVAEGENANNVEIAAGQGLILYSLQGCTINVPGAID